MPLSGGQRVPWFPIQPNGQRFLTVKHQPSFKLRSGGARTDRPGACLGQGNTSGVPRPTLQVTSESVFEYLSCLCMQSEKLIPAFWHLVLVRKEVENVIS